MVARIKIVCIEECPLRCRDCPKFTPFKDLNRRKK